jgi:hypothetical protein
MKRGFHGFMPWQTTYTELYFSDVLWPDFTEQDLSKFELVLYFRHAQKEINKLMNVDYEQELMELYRKAKQKRGNKRLILKLYTDFGFHLEVKTNILTEEI